LPNENAEEEAQGLNCEGKMEWTMMFMLWGERKCKNLSMNKQIWQNHLRKSKFQRVPFASDDDDENEVYEIPCCLCVLSFPFKISFKMCRRCFYFVAPCGRFVGVLTVVTVMSSMASWDALLYVA
jgi:hypothetical protein